MLKKSLKIIASLCAVAFGALVFLFAYLWWEHSRPLDLPTPTGHFAVGRASYIWVNGNVLDELSPNGADRETVVAWIWYPAASDARSLRADYFPSAWQTALARHSGILLSDFLTHDPKRVNVHSAMDAPVFGDRTSSAALPSTVAASSSYPVVILRAGAAAFSTDYTTLAEDLASHGFVVVGLDAPYRTGLVVLANGRVIERTERANLDLQDDAGARQLAEKLLPMWTQDIRFVLDRLQQLNAGDGGGRFTGRLDLHRLGIFGHSFGGAQALQFCHEDARCRAAIDIDGIPFGSVTADGLNKPGMILLSDHSREMQDPGGRQVLAALHSVYRHFPTGFFVTLRGANHFSFSDQILLKSRLLVTALMKVHILGHLEQERGLAITSDYVTTFFDVYLNGAPEADLAKLAKKYPGAEAEAH